MEKSGWRASRACCKNYSASPLRERRPSLAQSCPARRRSVCLDSHVAADTSCLPCDTSARQSPLSRLDVRNTVLGWIGTADSTLDCVQRGARTVGCERESSRGSVLRNRQVSAGHDLGIPDCETSASRSARSPPCRSPPVVSRRASMLGSAYRAAQRIEDTARRE